MPLGNGGGGGGGGSASDVRAGGTFVEVWLKDTLLQRGLDEAKAKFQAWGKAVNGMAVKTIAIGGAMIAPIVKQFWSVVSEAANAGKMRDMFGGTTESMSRLIDVFQAGGVDLESMTTLMKKLGQTASEEATKPVGGILWQLGIDAKKFIALNPEAKMEEIAAAMEKIPNEMDRTTALTKLFGKNGLEAFGVVGMGVDNFRKKMKNAEDDGVNISTEQANMARNVKKTWKLLTNSAHQMFQEIGNAVLPAADKVATFIRPFQSLIRLGREFIEANKTIIQIIAGVGIGLIVAGTAVTMFMKTFALIGAVLIPLKIAAGLVMALLSPIGLVVAAISGLTAVWMIQTQTGQEFAKRIGGFFSEVSETAKTTWGGIVLAIKQGDMESAFKIASLGARIVWLELMQFLSAEWVKFKNGWLSGINELFDALKSLAKTQLAAKDPNNLAGIAAGARVGFAIGKLAGPAGMVAGTLAGGMVGWITQEVALADERLKQLGLEGARPGGGGGGGMQGESEIEKLNRQLKEEIKALVKRAAGEPGHGSGISGIHGMAREIAGPAISPADVADAVKGAFQSPRWGQMLGVGDKVGDKRMLIATEAIKDGVKRVGDLLAAGGVIKLKA